MQLRPRLSHLPLILAVVAVATAVFVGLSLRLDDPLSTTALPAEDPYTHKTFVREHLRDGELNPLYDGGNVYPPGMHAFIAAVWVYTGFDLMAIMSLGPALFGALGVMGMALLLWRHTSPTGAVVGAWAYAVAPEVIFRTTMMAPTAMDLAVLPFLLYALLELARGRWAWGFVAAPVVAFFIFAHPWFLLVLGLAGALFLILSFLMPWPKSRAGEFTPIGVAGLIALFGVSASVVLMRGAAGTLELPTRFAIVEHAPLVLAASLVPLALVLLLPKLSRRLFPWWGRWRGALWVAIGVNLIVLAILAHWTQQAIAIGMPEQVRLQGMVGWPILVLAAGALLALPFLRGPLAIMGAAICLATYPFVIFNVFDSEFWPHRTAVFLAFGLVVMTGIAAWGAEQAGRAVAGSVRRWRHARRSRLQHPVPVGHDARMPMPMHPEHLRAQDAGMKIEPAGGSRSFRAGLASPASTGWVFLLPLVFIALPLAGAVSVITPDPYDGWYRLFDDCEHEVLEQVAAFANHDEDAIVVAGSWQAKMVVAAFTDNATRVWYHAGFFSHEPTRAGVLDWPRYHPFPMYVVVDGYVMDQVGVEELGFLKTPEWRPVTWGCAGPDSGGVGLFRFQGTPPPEHQ